jgi:Fe-S-cluster-containing hydrogenase component 2
MDTVILIRCSDCGETACRLVCGRDALVVVAGDVLVDTAKCSLCDKRDAKDRSLGEVTPSCVTRCARSANKALRAGSLREKRIAAAERMG